MGEERCGRGNREGPRDRRIPQLERTPGRKLLETEILKNVAGKWAGERFTHGRELWSQRVTRRRVGGRGWLRGALQLLLYV